MTKNTQSKWLEGLFWKSLFVLLLIYFIALPNAYWFYAQSIKTKPKQGTPPNAELMQKLHAYQKACSFWGFGKFYKQQVAAYLQENYHPASISLSFRRILQKGKMFEWKKNFKEWEQKLKKIEKMFPDFQLQHLRAYLYLQAGHFESLKDWGKRQTLGKPQKRTQALFQIWLGHAHFLTGSFESAQKYYQNVLQASRSHTNWEKRSPSSWRLPAAISTARYHTGLLQLKAQKPKQAYQTFKTLLQKWEAIHKQPNHSPLWYIANIWSAYAANRAGLPQESIKHLQQAQSYTKDPTLSQMLQAQIWQKSKLRSKHALSIWKSILQAPRKHSNSYADSAMIALFHYPLNFLKQGKVKPARGIIKKALKLLTLRDWPATLHELTAKNTFGKRYVPLPSHLYQKYAKLFAKDPKDKSFHHQLQLLEVFSHLKLYHWTKAQEKLQLLFQSLQHSNAQIPTTKAVQKQEKGSSPSSQPSSLKSFKKPILPAEKSVLFGAHLIQAMLYARQHKFAQARSHLEVLHKLSPEGSWALYNAYVLLQQKQPKTAFDRLSTLKRKGFWKKSQVHLKLLIQKKLYSEKRMQKVGFWWYILGKDGWMAERDGSLKKYSASWLANKKLWESSEVWELFRSVYVSQRKGRFSLSTQLARYKLQQLHFKLQGQSQKAERARQRWQAIHSFYKEFPEMWYLLDNTYYTHYLGLFAMGLF